MLICVVYRPLHAALLDDFEKDFDEISPVYSNIIITGDLNINLLHNTYQAKCLKDFCNAQSLYLVPFSATHHTSSSDT